MTGRRTLLRGCAAAGMALLVATVMPAMAAEAANAPVLPALLISYHAAPAQRPALREELLRRTLPRLRSLKADGRIEGYRLLFSRHADTDQWDALAVVVFSNPEQAARWAAVEREFPAAMDPQALALLNAVHTVPAEMARSRVSDQAAHSPVVLVIPYLSLVTPAEYLAYADGYVLPQFDGWMHEGALSQYALFSSTFPAARPWTHLIVQDWRGDEALATRAAVVAKVRGRLKDVPSWKAISDSKAKLREEKQAVVADDLEVKAAP